MDIFITRVKVYLYLPLKRAFNLEIISQCRTLKADVNFTLVRLAHAPGNAANQKCSQG